MAGTLDASYFMNPKKLPISTNESSTPMEARSPMTTMVRVSHAAVVRGGFACAVLWAAVDMIQLLSVGRARTPAGFSAGVRPCFRS
jgi:hypothetical protein